MTETILKNGVLGAFIIAMGWFIMYLMKQHRAERKEWQDTQQKNIDRSNERTDETNKVLRENTNILSGLKTLLENRK